MFKRIDHFMLDQAEKAKSTPYYSQVQELIGQISEETMPIAKYIGTVLFFFVPLLIVLLLGTLVSNAQSEAQEMEQLLENIHRLTANQRWLESNREKYLNLKVYDSEENFKQDITSMMNNANMNTSSVTFKDFDNDTSLGGSLEKASVKASIKDISTENLVNFQQQVETRKMKIEAMTLNYNPSTKLVDATFTIAHYGKYVSTLE